MDEMKRKKEIEERRRLAWNEYLKQYRLLHPDKVKQTKQKFVLSHRDEIKEYMRDYMKVYREKKRREEVDC